MSDYITLTFVVRTPTGEQPGDDPRTLLTDDEVMFWGREDGITEKALDLGADPSSWDEDEAPKVPDALYAEAEAAYDREDQEWFNSLSTEHLVAMWALCCNIETCPSWDDEVYDALAARGHWDPDETQAIVEDEEPQPLTYRRTTAGDLAEGDIFHRLPAYDDESLDHRVVGVDRHVPRHIIVTNASGDALAMSLDEPIEVVE